MLPRLGVRSREDDFDEREDAVQPVHADVDPLLEAARRPPGVHGCPEDDGDQERERRDGRIVQTVRELQRTREADVQICAAVEGVHEGVVAGDEEVEPHAPEGEVCEEAEGVADGGGGLVEGVAVEVYVFEGGGGRVVPEPGVACDDCGEAVEHEEGAGGC